MSLQPWRLTATQAIAKFRSNDLSVQDYAVSLLGRIDERDNDVQAWAYLDRKAVMRQAKALDAVPVEERGPLHGLPVAVKDIIYTKDMPTQHNSPLYKGSFPQVDAASVRILRQAGALIFGKTTTTQFAAIQAGPPTKNPHARDTLRTPGGSSAGSGAAVADFQIPVSLGTQTGGSIIRPASFNGIYGLKPTWGAVSREGLKVSSLTLDTIGWFGRSVGDLELLADVYDIQDDQEASDAFQGIKGARFAICKSPAWSSAGPGTQAALSRASELLRAHGAIVEDLDLPSDFDNMAEYHSTVLYTEGRVSFLSEYRVDKDKLDPALVSQVENTITRKTQLEAYDRIATLRPEIDEIAGRYAAVVTPSVIDEAPVGLESTGSHIFCRMWSALHTPVVNIPGFKGAHGMPIGLTLVAPRYRDRHLLKVSKAVGDIFETEGGWKSRL